MKFQFGKGVYERDIDLLLMRKIATDKDFVRKFFLSADELAAKGYDKTDFTVEKVAQSVMTEDGESDVEAIISIGDKRIALLIEDKIDAPAMEEQSARYSVRGEKAIARSEYDEFYVFIVAPEKYISGNAEAKKYANKITYEALQDGLGDGFDGAMVEYALSDANIVRLPRDVAVTAFWDQIYDFVEEKYPKTFKLPGYKGLERSGEKYQWISMPFPLKPFIIEIKTDRGYVDLEIGGFGDKFEQFSKANKKVIEERNLCFRSASKSLAIRKYLKSHIDFTASFDSQIPALTEAFDAAKELKDLIPWLKLS